MIQSHILSCIKQNSYYKAIVGIIFENLILSYFGGVVGYWKKDYGERDYFIF